MVAWNIISDFVDAFFVLQQSILFRLMDFLSIDWNRSKFNGKDVHNFDWTPGSVHDICVDWFQRWFALFVA